MCSTEPGDPPRTTTAVAALSSLGAVRCPIQAIEGSRSSTVGSFRSLTTVPPDRAPRHPSICWI